MTGQLGQETKVRKERAKEQGPWQGERQCADRGATAGLASCSMNFLLYPRAVGVLQLF